MSPFAVPTAPSERLEFVDALRGFALFGVFWANLLIFSGITYMSDAQRTALFPAPGDAHAYLVQRFLIETKFIGLFSTLFGVSFWLFLSRAGARQNAPTGLFYRRIFWLFAFGALHGWLLWAFDVLRFYAMWGLLLPLFVRTDPRRLLALGLGFSVLVPALVVALRVSFLPPAAAGALDIEALALAAFRDGSYREMLAANWAYDWYLTLSISPWAYQLAVLGRLLLGLYLARTLDLGNLEAHRPLLRKVLLVAGAAGLAGSVVFAGDLLTGGTSTPLRAFVRRLAVESGHLGLTLSYAAGLALLFLAARWRPLILWLAPVGKMALTWYLAQTAFGIWMFYGFARGPALMAQVGPAALAAIALVGFAAQVALARLWLGVFRFGPAEWLWRTLTYWRTQPFRLGLPPAGLQAQR